MTSGEENVDVNRFLIFTYTRAAAAELRGEGHGGAVRNAWPPSRGTVSFAARQELIRHASISTIQQLLH
jgi:hypothetical protein